MSHTTRMLHIFYIRQTLYKHTTFGFFEEGQLVNQEVKEKEIIGYKTEK